MKAILPLALLLILFFQDSFAQTKNLPDQEILQFGFIDPLDKKFGLINKPVLTIGELNNQLLSFYIPANQFYNAYDSLTLNYDQISKTDSIIAINYKLANKSYNSYSLYKPHSNVGSSHTAVLIIPGSGMNQASEIFNNVGYHRNIAEEASDIGDVYISVKPNDDFLAIHNSYSKLSYSFLTNYLINMGGSYSASYLINSIATVKHLKERYNRIMVIGLSQGGSAALLVSLQTSPDATVISSGFTITRDEFEWAFQDQIVIPELITKYSNEYIYKRIKEQNTNYYFSWSTNELGIYKMEAYNGYTANYFKDLPNVMCESHVQGHFFPNPHVKNFMSSIPYAAIALISESAGSCDNSLFLQANTTQGAKLTSYQWYRNGAPVQQMEEKLELGAGGSYSVLVRNNLGKIYETSTFHLDKQTFEKNISLRNRVIFAPTGYDSYKWYLNGQLIENTASDLVVSSPGEYQVIMSDNYSCITSNIIKVLDSYPVHGDNLTATVFPNPNNGNFTIRVVSPYQEEVKFVLLDPFGKKIFERNFTKGLNRDFYEVTARNLLPGLYFLKSQSPRNEHVTRVIVK